ncbi:MAG: hypothetical protein GY929_24730 [Actinomycetia bacterium]|nr:hypothetical protein [Actinomycetes bacterium]
MIDSVALYDRLAGMMNDRPNTYETLGDIYMDLALILRRDGGDARILLGFEGIQCVRVAEFDDGEEANADCWLEGDLDSWQKMFDDILANGKATGEWTLNAATMVGEDIKLEATDPMGWDKFHRFNQTLQEFFDASAEVLSEEVSDASA